MDAAPWTWTYADAEGQPVQPPGAAPGGFGTQADAETWVGESWRGLLAEGVDSVTLLEDGAMVYGPMPLHPAQ